MGLYHAVAILSQGIYKACLCTTSLVERTRLAVHKETFSNLPRQNGQHATKVYRVVNRRLVSSVGRALVC